MVRTVSSYLQERDNNFDFIRFCAALLVIFSHSFEITSAVKDPLYTFSSGKLSFGNLSVAVFFVISGMLIAQSFDRSADLPRFLRARALRIFPALAVVVLLSVFLLGPWMTTLSLEEYFLNSGTMKYLVNMLAIKIKFSLPGVFEDNVFPSSVNGSLWTLPLEIGCYALVAAVGFCLKKQYLRSTLFFLVVLLLYSDTLLNVNTYYFALGTLVYIFRERIVLHRSVAWVSFLLFVLNLYANHHLVSAYFIMGITLTYFLLFIGFTRTGRLRNFSKGGDLSYGLYIYAFPVQQVISIQQSSLNPFQHFVVSAAITLILAYFSWHLVEKRALRLKKKMAHTTSPLQISSRQHGKRNNTVG